MLEQSYKILDSIRLPHGLYIASPSEFYSYVWIRDSVYISLPYLDKNDGLYEKTYHGLLDMFRNYEWKIDIAIKKKPHYMWEYIHARYNASDVTEIHDQEWGHAQHDAVGAVLWAIGEGVKKGKKILRDEKDKEIVQKLVYYLQSVEYWKDPDNGMWEEWREVHLSSVGACVAGLKNVTDLVNVPKDLITKGIDACMNLFPRESNDKAVDLAQLSLLYPYNLFSGIFGERIVEQVESRLLRDRGVIRYEGDSYYSTLEETHGRDRAREFYYGTEAEWCFGIPWLALCHLDMGNIEKAEYYVNKTEELMIEPGILPELYYSGKDTPNPNTPLGWSVAMYILAKEAVEKAK
jgi:GH15 family glucan-1,4-alpha-glucosidase